MKRGFWPGLLVLSLLTLAVIALLRRCPAERAARRDSPAYATTPPRSSPPRQPDPGSTEAPAIDLRLRWTAVPLDIALLPSPFLISCNPNHPTRTLAALAAETACARRLLGMPADQADLRLRSLASLRKLDLALLHELGVAISEEGERKPPAFRDPPEAVAARLIALLEGRDSTLVEKVSEDCDFAEVELAIRHRAAAMLGKFATQSDAQAALRRLLGADVDSATKAICAAALMRVGVDLAGQVEFDAPFERALLGAVAHGYQRCVVMSNPLLARSFIVTTGPEWEQPLVRAKIVEAVQTPRDREHYLSAIRVLNQASDLAENRALVRQAWLAAEHESDVALVLLQDTCRWLGDPEIDEITRKLSESKDRQVQLHALLRLGLHESPRSVDLLVQALHGTDRTRQLVAATALASNGALQPEVTLPALDALWRDKPRDELVDEARHAASRIRSRLRDREEASKRNRALAEKLRMAYADGRD